MLQFLWLVSLFKVLLKNWILESLNLPPCTSECAPPLNVKADCSFEESEMISGQYLPVGGYNGRTIYEKTETDINSNWWSLRYDSSTQWTFKWQSNQIKKGENHFDENIEDCSNQQG